MTTTQYILLAIVGFGILMWAYANIGTAFIFMGKKNKEADQEAEKQLRQKANPGSQEEANPGSQEGVNQDKKE